MMSGKKQSFDPKDRQILYTFWDELPERKIIVDYDDNFFTHLARKLIFHIVGKGVKEQTPSGEEGIRRALNAQEIHQRVKDLSQIKFKGREIPKELDLSLHSLYFHIQKLEEVGFIKTVAILKEGRHNVSYYGRVAKIVLFKENYKEDENIKNSFNAMSKIATLLNPNHGSEKVMEFYDDFVAINKESLDIIQRKLAKFEKQINDADIDPNDLQTFFTLMNSINPKFIKLFSEIIDYFYLKIWD